MPRLRVIAAGASSLQGLGRYGAQRYGLAPGGAMDRLSLAESNALVRQPSGAAAIEIGPLPARFEVEDGPIRFAVAGAERDVTLDGRKVQLGRTLRAEGGAVIALRGAVGGQFSYLAFEGGVKGASRADAGIQPARERSFVLASGDGIDLEPARRNRLESELRLHTRSGAPIRVVLGPQLDYFAPE